MVIPTAIPPNTPPVIAAVLREAIRLLSAFLTGVDCAEELLVVMIVSVTAMGMTGAVAVLMRVVSPATVV